MTIKNALAQTDFYKYAHVHLGIDGVSEMYGNYTSRHGKLSNVKGSTDVTFVGLQYFIKDVLLGEWQETFFDLPKEVAVGSMKRIAQYCLGQEDYDTKPFEDLHDLGFLPIIIKALPEGVAVPYGVPPVTFKTTHGERFAWLEGFLETVFSCENWYVQTSATTARAYLKRTIKAFDAAGLPHDLVPFMCHDFSFRGLAGRHAAALSGFGHLTSFAGTDTIPAILFAEKYYNANMETELVGSSVNATEHSITTTAINSIVAETGVTKLQAEVEYVRMLMKKCPTGILSHVSDSYDFWAFVTEGLPQLKDEILSRDGKLVIRPDSGNIVDVLCGKNASYKTLSQEPETIKEWKEWVAEEVDDIFRMNLDAEDPHNSETHIFKGKFGVFEVTYEPELNRHDKTYYYVDNYDETVSYCSFTEIHESAEDKGLVQVLGEMFGTTESPTGLKLLNDKIGAIYGDSVTLERQDQIISRLEAKGYAGLVVLGVGSYSYQYVTRDTHGSAVKTTYAVKDGKPVNVYKDPKTDSKKKSLKGLIRVELENGKYVAYDQQTTEQEKQGELKEVFRDGKLLYETSLAEIRERVKASL